MNGGLTLKLDTKMQHAMCDLIDKAAEKSQIFSLPELYRQNLQVCALDGKYQISTTEVTHK